MSTTAGAYPRPFPSSASAPVPQHHHTAPQQYPAFPMNAWPVLHQPHHHHHSTVHTGVNHPSYHMYHVPVHSTSIVSVVPLQTPNVAAVLPAPNGTPHHLHHTVHTAHTAPWCGTHYHHHHHHHHHQQQQQQQQEKHQYLQMHPTITTQENAENGFPKEASSTSVRIDSQSLSPATVRNQKRPVPTWTQVSPKRIITRRENNAKRQLTHEFSGIQKWKYTSAKRGRTSKRPLTREDIMAVIDYAQSDAALLLGVSLSTLKRRFYELCVGRWPYPQLKLPRDQREHLTRQYKELIGTGVHLDEEEEEEEEDTDAIVERSRDLNLHLDTSTLSSTVSSTTDGTSTTCDSSSRSSCGSDVSVLSSSTAPDNYSATTAAAAVNKMSVAAICNEENSAVDEHTEEQLIQAMLRTTAGKV